MPWVGVGSVLYCRSLVVVTDVRFTIERRLAELFELAELWPKAATGVHEPVVDLLTLERQRLGCFLFDRAQPWQPRVAASNWRSGGIAACSLRLVGATMGRLLDDAFFW